MIAGAVGTFYRRELRKRGLLLVFPIAAALAIVVALLFFAPRVNQRFGLEGFFDPGRWNVYKSTIEIIGDYPWLGSGLGTFRWAFPAYRSGNIPSYGIWEEAHNTTLEMASEMGIPFTMLLGAAWLAIFLTLGRGMLRRRRNAIFSISAFWMGLLAILHSQVDFPLQIPGLSLAICPLIGMGLAQSVSSRREALT
jgi:O-antigen ligase